MALPISERLKNIEQQFKELENQVYYSHPIEDNVFHGVIKQINSDDCEGYLLVAPYPPATVSSNGTLNFEDIDQHPLRNTDAGTRLDRVYPVNIPSELIRGFFRVGDSIKYWHYSGQSVGNDYADKIKGSYVTLVDEWSFWAEVNWDPGTQTHSFWMVQYDPTVSSKWDYVYLCDGETEFSGHCENLDNKFGVVRSERSTTPFITRVYRMTNPNPAGSPKFHYFFHNRVVIHWGKIKEVIKGEGCTNQHWMVRPTDHLGNYLAADPAVVVAVYPATPTTCNPLGYCLNEDDLIAYILYEESTGFQVNPYKFISVRYLCDNVIAQVDDLQSLNFEQFDFTITTADLGDCPGIAEITWKGFRVTDRDLINCDGVKELRMDTPDVDPPEGKKWVSFALDCDDAMDTVPNSEGLEPCEVQFKRATITGTVSVVQKAVVTDVVCNGDGTITVTKENIWALAD